MRSNIPTSILFLVATALTQSLIVTGKQLDYDASVPVNDVGFHVDRAKSHGLESTIHGRKVGDASIPIKSRVDRASNADSLKSSVHRLKTLARVTNGISIQQGLNTGTIPPDDLISELLRFGSVTPTQIAVMNMSMIHEAVGTMKNLPITPSQDVQDVESNFGKLKEIWLEINGIGNLAEWNESAVFEAEIKNLESNGINLTFIGTTEGAISKFFGVLNYGLTINNDTNTLKQTIKDMGRYTTAILNLAPQFNTTKPQWKFDFKSAVDGLTPVIQGLKGVAKYGQHAGHLSISIANENAFVKFLSEFKTSTERIQNMQSSLQKIHELVSSREKQRNSRLKYAVSFLYDSTDLSNVEIDLKEDWMKKLGAEGLADALKGLGSMEAPIKNIEKKLEGFKDSGKVSSLLKMVEPIVDVTSRSDKLKETVTATKSCDLPKSSQTNTFSGVQTSISDISKSLDTILKSIDQIFHILTDPNILKISESLIQLTNGTTPENAVETREKIQNFTSLVTLNTAFENIKYELSKNIKNLSDSIKTEAGKIATNDFKVFRSSLKELSSQYSTYFTCLQNLHGLPEMFKAIEDIKSIRGSNSDTNYNNDLANGLGVVKKVVDASEDMNKLKKVMIGMKVQRRRRSSSSEADVLKDFKNAQANAQMIGLSVRGISSMHNALEKKMMVDSVAASGKLVQGWMNVLKQPEDLKNLKKLVALDVEVKKMYASLDKFKNSVVDSDSVILVNHSSIFEQAKRVAGLDVNFALVAITIGKLSDQVSDPARQGSLNKLKGSLETLDTMDLNFASYKSEFGEVKRSLEALDIFFASVRTRLGKKTATTPAPPVETAEGFPWYMYIVIIGSTLALTLLTIGLLLGARKYRDIRKYKQGITINLVYYFIHDLYTLMHKFSKHKKAFNPEMYYGFFKHLYPMDSARSFVGPSAYVEKHADEQRYTVGLCKETQVFSKEFPDDSYMHASFVTMLEREADKKKKMILTQAPRKDKNKKKKKVFGTLAQFMYMLKEQSVGIVVQLCQTKEDDKSVCEGYAVGDANTTHDYEDVKITIKTLQNILESLQLRRLSIQLEGCKEPYEVDHYWYTDWPENGSPKNVDSLLALLEIVNKDKKVTVVHCTDGIGRAGCFAFIEYLRQLIWRPGRVVLGDALEEFRKMRADSVTSDRQYGLCAYMAIKSALKEYIIDKPDIKKEFAAIEEGFEDWDDGKECFEKREQKKSNY